MKLKLVAFNLNLYYAWKNYFDPISDVEVIDGDILALDGDAIVSPANSFGYMDGGLDLKLSQHFGWELESRVRNILELEYFGELPVGNALIVKTENDSVPFLISAPTMRVPSNVSDTVNAYLAFKAILQACLKHNQLSESKINTILCPGLGTGEGKLSAENCAMQMFKAYQTVIEGQFLRSGGLAAAVNNHIELLGNNTS